MTRLLRCAGVGLLLLTGLVAARVAWAQPSVTGESDTQKLLFRNAVVAVYEIRVPPGTFEPRHSHARGVTVALSDYDNEVTTFPDGRVTRGHTRAHDAKWVEPVTHEVRNVGRTEQHVIRIEIR